VNAGLIALLASGGIIAVCGAGYLLFNSKFWAANRERFALNGRTKTAIEVIGLCLFTAGWLLPAFGPERGEHLARFAALPGLVIVLAGLVRKSDTVGRIGVMVAVAGWLGAEVLSGLRETNSIVEAMRHMALPGMLALTLVATLLYGQWKAQSAKKDGTA